jgi:hypothetical protein
MMFKVSLENLKPQTQNTGNQRHKPIKIQTLSETTKNVIIN